jgi:hypothetical protein
MRRATSNGAVARLPALPNAETVAMLEEHGADAGLVELLRRAPGAREGLEVRWARE